MRIRIEFKPTDLCVGVYFGRTIDPSWFGEDWDIASHAPMNYDMWIFLIPMLAIRLTWTKLKKRSVDDDDDAPMPCCGQHPCLNCGCCKCNGCCCYQEEEESDLDPDCGEIYTDPYGDIPCMMCHRDPCVCDAWEGD